MGEEDVCVCVCWREFSGGEDGWVREECKEQASKDARVVSKVQKHTAVCVQ